MLQRDAGSLQVLPIVCYPETAESFPTKTTTFQGPDCFNERKETNSWVFSTASRWCPSPQPITSLGCPLFCLTHTGAVSSFILTVWFRSPFPGSREGWQGREDKRWQFDSFFFTVMNQTALSFPCLPELYTLFFLYRNGGEGGTLQHLPLNVVYPSHVGSYGVAAASVWEFIFSLFGSCFFRVNCNRKPWILFLPNVCQWLWAISKTMLHLIHK